MATDFQCLLNRAAHKKSHPRVAFVAAQKITWRRKQVLRWQKLRHRRPKLRKRLLQVLARERVLPRVLVLAQEPALLSCRKRRGKQQQPA